MKVWVFYGTSEAGDYYGPAVFDYPVTRAEIAAEMDSLYPGVEINIRIWDEEVNTRVPAPTHNGEGE